jgi:transaldolase
LFSREQYVAAAEAFLRGIERRIDTGLNPNVGSVASVFISRWDVAVMNKVPDALRDRLGIAIAQRTYKAYRALLGSPRWQRVYNAGARPQRLLWASTGTKDPKASDVLYIKALAAAFTVNTMPEGTLKALAEHGDVGRLLPVDGGDCETVLNVSGRIKAASRGRFKSRHFEENSVRHLRFQRSPLKELPHDEPAQNGHDRNHSVIAPAWLV